MYPNYRSALRPSPRVIITTEVHTHFIGAYQTGDYLCTNSLCLSVSQNQRMQQPLAHLYFFTLLEHLQAQEYKLSGLVRISNSIIWQCTSLAIREVESIVLWVELQAVVQVILQKLATVLDPDCDPSEYHIGEIQPIMDDINR